MKNKFYLYTFLLVGLFNLSSTSWSATVDPGEDLTTQGGYTTRSNTLGRSVYFNLEVGSADHDDGTIIQTETFNTLKTEGSVKLNQAFMPSLTGNTTFTLDQGCLNHEIFQSKTISNIIFDGKCENTSKGLRCSDMSIIFHVYDRELNIVPAVQISCNASIVTN